MIFTLLPKEPQVPKHDFVYIKFPKARFTLFLRKDFHEPNIYDQVNTWVLMMHVSCDQCQLVAVTLGSTATLWDKLFCDSLCHHGPAASLSCVEHKVGITFLPTSSKLTISMDEEVKRIHHAWVVVLSYSDLPKRHREHRWFIEHKNCQLWVWKDSLISCPSHVIYSLALWSLYFQRTRIKWSNLLSFLYIHCPV